jgi:hypothetical protein
MHNISLAIQIRNRIKSFLNIIKISCVTVHSLLKIISKHTYENLRRVSFLIKLHYISDFVLKANILVVLSFFEMHILFNI